MDPIDRMVLKPNPKNTHFNYLFFDIMDNCNFNIIVYNYFITYYNIYQSYYLNMYVINSLYN